MRSLQPADEDAEIASILDALIADELGFLDLIQLPAELIVRLRPLTGHLGLGIGT